MNTSDQKEEQTIQNQWSVWKMFSDARESQNENCTVNMAGNGHYAACHKIVQRVAYHSAVQANNKVIYAAYSPYRPV